jgi:microcystin-dependent protein
MYGRPHFYRLGDSQKQYAHLQLRLQAPVGHGSLPARDTIRAKWGRALFTLGQARMPYHKTPLAEHIIRTMSHALPAEAAQVLDGLLDPAHFETTMAGINLVHQLWRPGAIRVAQAILSSQFD